MQGSEKDFLPSCSVELWTLCLSYANGSLFHSRCIHIGDACCLYRTAVVRGLKPRARRRWEFLRLGEWDTMTEGVDYPVKHFCTLILLWKIYSELWAFPLKCIYIHIYIDFVKCQESMCDCYEPLIKLDRGERHGVCHGHPHIFSYLVFMALNHVDYIISTL